MFTLEWEFPCLRSRFMEKRKFSCLQLIPGLRLERTFHKTPSNLFLPKRYCLSPQSPCVGRFTVSLLLPIFRNCLFSVLCQILQFPSSFSIQPRFKFGVSLNSCVSSFLNHFCFFLMFQDFAALENINNENCSGMLLWNFVGEKLWQGSAFVH